MNNSPSQFLNPDGSKWTSKQIQEYYIQWSRYYQQNPNEQQAPGFNLLTKATDQQKAAQTYNPFNKAVLSKQSGLSALETARLGGFAPKISTTVAIPHVSSNPSTPKDDFPASFKAYVTKVFELVPKLKRPLIERKLKRLIERETKGNSMWITAWELMPLPDMNSIETDLPTVLSPKPVLISKKRKKAEPKIKEIAVPVVEKKKVTMMQDFELIDLTKQEQRKNRFDQEQKEQMSRMQRKQVKPSRSERTEEGLDWNEHAIIGTCAELEKPYLRLTAAPDPSTVRPQVILEKSLKRLRRKWDEDRNYIYICDQFKSLRQDLTVQRIKNSFTVLVYESHARIAIQKGDLGEFNQCSGQLKELYSLFNLKGEEDEFVAYRILYLIHTQNRRDLIEEIASLKNPGEAVTHSLKVRSSLSTGDYHTFFNLYHLAPNLSTLLMDHFLYRERLKTLLKLTRAYRPTLSIEFFAFNLGFVAPTKSIVNRNLGEVFSFIKKTGVEISKGDVDCKVAVSILAPLIAQLGVKGVDIK